MVLILVSKNSSDIYNGNYTLPVIYFCLDNSISTFNSNEIEIFMKNKDTYIKKALKKVAFYKEAALKALNIIPESEYKKVLINITERTLEE